MDYYNEGELDLFSEIDLEELGGAGETPTNQNISSDAMDVGQATANPARDAHPSDDIEEESPDAAKNIEDMVLTFLHQLAFPGSMHQMSADPDEAEIRPQNRKGKSRIVLRIADRTKANPDGSPSYRAIKYPRKCSAGSAKQLAQLFRVLDLAHDAIIGGTPATKRDIFYNDVTLFGKQRVVDSLVDDLAATFELERSDLFIRATSKGLICGGGLAIHLHSGEIIKSGDTEGTLIPTGENIQSFTIDSNVAWVLVVEKDAVFQTLCRLLVTNHPSLPGRGIIITGKGYPDVATRHLVKTLADCLPLSIPILALVDGDPYGIDIVCVYKYGSQGLRHESEKLAAGRIKWLGLWASELQELGINRDMLLPITKSDEKKALNLLQRPHTQMPKRWRKELMQMLHSRRKAEIEILSSIRLVPAVEISIGHETEDVELHDGAGPDSLGRILPDSHGFYSMAPFLIPGSTAQSASSPLLRYLSEKITRYVCSSQIRTQGDSTANKQANHCTSVETRESVHPILKPEEFGTA